MAVERVATRPLPVSRTTQDNPELPLMGYNFNQLSFPSNVGSDEVGHYLIININAPTKIGGGAFAGNFTEGFGNSTDLSKVEQLRRLGGGSILSGRGAGAYAAGISEADVSLPIFGTLRIERQTRRITDAIALHMPTPLLFEHQNQYQEIGLTALAVKAGGTILGAIAGKISPALGGAIATSGITSDTFLNAAQGVGALMQSPINPMVEILFATTHLRQFTMEWLLAPRSEAESAAIKNIIKTLRFHSVPELMAGGLLWIPPAEFDISFYTRGEENQNLLRFNTLVLERASVDYSPTGIFSTFRNGHPVAIRLSTSWRELEPLHKMRISQGL